MRTGEEEPNLIGDIVVLETTMREVAEHGPAQRDMVHVTAFAHAFHLEAQKGPGNEDRLEFWRHGQDFETSVSGMTALLREMVVMPRTPEADIALVAAMTLRTLTLCVVETDRRTLAEQKCKLDITS